ncbi:MAG: fibronectin type III domain-containing protein [Phycisphaerales bacterium]|nr:MAG: fibronectin type III domain-containing protein [Phycisphaerales bacterium]
MKILPSGRADLIQFARVHFPVWADDPDGVGLSVARIAAMQEALAAAEAAQEEARALREAAQAATLLANSAMAALREQTAMGIATIKTFARLATIAGDVPNEETVYAAARLDEPLAPRTLPAPGVVRNVTLTIDTQGRPTVRWKSPHPADARERAASRAGLWFTIQKRAPGSRDFTDLASLGGSTDSYTDAPLAAGTTFYRVRATRGDRAGPWSLAVPVQSGVGDGGGVASHGEHAALSNAIALAAG